MSASTSFRWSELWRVLAYSAAAALAFAALERLELALFDVARHGALLERTGSPSADGQPAAQPRATPRQADAIVASAPDEDRRRRAGRRRAG
jgi:hypothetical protein